MNAGPSRVLSLLAASGLVASGAASVNAQVQQPADGEPLIVGQDDEYDWWQLDEMGAAVDTRYRYRSFRRNTNGQPELVDTEQYMLGRLELSGRAFVGHKNLLDISGTVAIGWEQTDLDSDVVGSSQTDSDLSLLYDVSGLILAESYAPTTVYSRREERQLEREFAGSIDASSAEHGILTRIQSQSMPTSIHLYRRENDQNDRFGAIDYELKQDSLAVRTSPDLGENQDLSVEYQLDIVDERQSSGFENSYTRHDLQAIHLIDFGDQKQHNLRSTGRIYDESGQADIRRFRIDEVLRLQHTEAFDTRWEATAEETNRSDQWQRFARARAQARYKLFDSLVAIGSVGADRTDISGNFSSRHYFTDAYLEYSKTVPGGRVFASVGGGLDRQDNSEQGQPVLFTDQSLRLSDPLPTLIQRRNIVGSSIRITNSSGTRVYTEGIDYTVQVFPSHVEITRIVGGNITDGESLLVDYTVGPEPASTVDSYSANASARYRFEEGALAGLSLYVNYNWLDQTVDTADPSQFILEELRDLRYGVDYYRGPFTFQLEQRHHDSVLQPYDQTRFEGRYDIRPGPLATLSASLTHDYTDFEDTGEERNLTRATIRAAGRIGDGLDIGGRIVYRDERSKLSTDLAGFEQALDVTWRKGKTTITGSLFNGVLDTDETDSFSQSISIGIRRTF